jgi:hypothetical protein
MRDPKVATEVTKNRSRERNMNMDRRRILIGASAFVASGMIGPGARAVEINPPPYVAADAELALALAPDAKPAGDGAAH